MRILGLDPGLRNTGWGVIETQGNRLRYIADGVVNSDAKLTLAERLNQLFEGVFEIAEGFEPQEAAIEETFVNMNPNSTLKLGQARGAIILAPARLKIPVFEYAPNKIKKAVVGSGHAAKEQVVSMIKMLLPGCNPKSTDSADALAIAICHAYNRPILR
jgi:crossover junction endodeoxyribonuclease RuvC